MPALIHPICRPEGMFTDWTSLLPVIAVPQALSLTHPGAVISHFSIRGQADYRRPKPIRAEAMSFAASGLPILLQLSLIFLASASLSMVSTKIL